MTRRGLLAGLSLAHLGTAYAVHPTRRLVYAVHDVAEVDHLPRGAVDTYALEPDGCLSWLARRPLSLSATYPKDLAVAPDGEVVIVVAYGGEALNVLPIATDGTLGRPTQILKLLHAPRQVRFAGPGEVTVETEGPTLRYRYRAAALILAPALGSDIIRIGGDVAE